MARHELVITKNFLKCAIPATTPWTFVRAAGVANLLVATQVFIEFSVIALVNRDGKVFQLGLTLIPFVTVVIWCTAAVFCVLALAPKRLWMLGRRLLKSRRSGVWDDWLDSPEPYHP